MHISDDAFKRVGLRVGSRQARAFVASLGDVAEAERDDAASVASNRWARRASDRALGALSRCQLGDLVADLGLGSVDFAEPDSGDPADPVRAVLRHLLRDRLIDVLRISAGQRPLWCWPAVSGGDVLGLDHLV